jgi:hypothetical protein
MIMSLRPVWAMEQELFLKNFKKKLFGNTHVWHTLGVMGKQVFLKK